MDAATILAKTEVPATLPIDLETTPEFEVFKNAKLVEVKEYLDNNWGIKDAELVMTPQYVFPDRNNRRAYASVASGQSFRDKDNTVVVNPITGKPMIYTVWRKIPPPPLTELEIADTKPEIELEPAAAIA